MKRTIIIPSVGLLMLLVFGAASARADMVNPFGLGALGAGLGFIAGGNARSAAIGGVAGLGAGMILNAAQGPRYGYYDYGPRYGYYSVGYFPPPPPYHGPRHYGPGPWPRHRPCYSCGPGPGYRGGPPPPRW